MRKEEKPIEEKDERSHTEKDTSTLKHPAFGMIGFHRISSSHGKHLFGSAVQHKQTITLKISKACMDRNLNTDWFHAETRPIIEVELSQTQFAEAISTFNQGEGIPCTIRRIKDEQIPEIAEHENRKDRFSREARERIHGIAKLIRSKRIEELLSKKGALNVKEKEEIKANYTKVIQEIQSNLPFLQDCFVEAMDKTVLEAKGEIEAFIQNKVNTLGIKALQNETEKFLEDKGE